MGKIIEEKTVGYLFNELNFFLKKIYGEKLPDYQKFCIDDLFARAYQIHNYEKEIAEFDDKGKIKKELYNLFFEKYKNLVKYQQEAEEELIKKLNNLWLKASSGQSILQEEE